MATRWNVNEGGEWRRWSITATVCGSGGDGLVVVVVMVGPAVGVLIVERW